MTNHPRVNSLVFGEYVFKVLPSAKNSDQPRRGPKGLPILRNFGPAKQVHRFWAPKSTICLQEHLDTDHDDPDRISVTTPAFPHFISVRDLLRQPLAPVNEFTSRVEVPRVTGRFRDQVEHDVLQAVSYTHLRAHETGRN